MQTMRRYKYPAIRLALIPGLVEALYDGALATGDNGRGGSRAIRESVRACASPPFRVGSCGVILASSHTISQPTWRQTCSACALWHAHPSRLHHGLHPQGSRSWSGGTCHVQVAEDWAGQRSRYTSDWMLMGAGSPTDRQCAHSG